MITNLINVFSDDKCSYHILCYINPDQVDTLYQRILGKNKCVSRRGSSTQLLFYFFDIALDTSSKSLKVILIVRNKKFNVKMVKRRTKKAQQEPIQELFR
jgi:hypothetical protein